MEQMNYSSMLPTDPPGDVVTWLFNRGCFKKEYIVYKSAWVKNPLTGIKERMVNCTCSACENEWYEQRVEAGGCHNAYAPAPFGFRNSEYNDSVIDGQVTICPFCDTEAQAVHIGNIRNTRAVDEIYPITVDRICDHISKYYIAIIAWRIVRVLHKDGHMRFEKYPYEAYVCENRKIVRLTAYIPGSYRSKICTGVWSQKKSFKDTFGKIGAQLIYPFDPALLIGTSLENSKLDMYMKSDSIICPVSYCNLFLKHKNVENLIMQNMSKLVNDKLLKLAASYYCDSVSSVTHIEGINWSEQKPHRMLGLTKDEFRTAKKEAWKDADLNFYLTARCAGVCPEDVAKCQKYGYGTVETFIKNHPSQYIMKILRYLDRQKKKYPKQREASLTDLSDYWDMLPQIGETANENEVLYPQNLIRAHDVTMERIKYEESKELRAAFVQRFHKLSRFDYVFNGLFIRPAASEAELIAEGKRLHHCVGGYAKRHSNGETAIFFIRHVSDPDASYFTLELDEKSLSVKQNRGRCNCARTDEVIMFEEKWLEHIRNLKEAKKNGKQRSNVKSTAA